MIFAMEPTLTTRPELAGVLAELAALEPIFHHPELGTTRADFERMVTDDFWETGASGWRYSRTFVLQVLEQRAAAPQQDIWETSDFYCRQLSPEIFLLTYTLLQDNHRLTRRASIWQRSREGWRAVYHQGTVVE